MKRTMLVVLTLLALVAVLNACAPAPTPAPTAAPPTAAPKPTEAPKATAAPTTAAAQSTAAPKPTEAAKPTEAPKATTAATGPTATAAPKATAVPVPAGATKFDFWHAMSGTNGEAIAEMMGRFNSSQSKCYGTPIFQGSYDDNLNKVKAGLQSKDVPALLQMYDLGTQLFADLGVAVPMQDFIDKDKYDISDYEDKVLNYYRINGRLNGMPFNTSTPILYYNKDLFKAAGLDPAKPPRTYAEVIDAAKKLTKKDASGKVTVWGYGISIYGWIFEQLLAAAGGMYLDNGNGRDARATKATFNSPEGVAAVQFWKDGYDAGVFANLGRAPAGNDAVVAAFNAGQVAMYIESTARLRGHINSTAGKFEVGTAFIPRPNEDAFKKSGVIIGGASVYIMKDRPQAEQDCAWQFVKFATSPDLQAYWHTASGYYPVRKASYNVPLDKDWVAKYPQFTTAVDQLHASPNVRPADGGLSGAMPQARQETELAIEKVLNGSQTPQQALDAAAATVTKAVGDYNKSVGK